MSAFEDLELEEDGTRLVSAVLGMSIFSEASLSSAAGGVLDLYERVLSAVQKTTLRFHATETMRRHKPITKGTWSLLPTWLAPDGPQRDYVSLQLKDGETYQDAPRRKFQIHGYEPKNPLFNRGRANVVSVALPGSRQAADLTRLKELFVHACTVLPMRSGIAGPTLECSRYEGEASETHAWTVGMRLPGLDICRIPMDGQAVGTDGLKGVGWLTALGRPLVERLGGMAELKRGWPEEITSIETPHGVVIQAGDRPRLGDVDHEDTLELYRAIYERSLP